MRTRLGVSLLMAAAAAGSLLAHALLFATFSVVRVGGAVPAEVAEMTVVFEEPAAPPKPDNPPLEFEIGRPEAKGYATHEVTGREEQIAREAPQDQPELSFDPVGQ